MNRSDPTPVMNLESLIAVAAQQGASDLHLEPGLPAALRVRGLLRIAGEPLTGNVLLAMGRELLGHELWTQFLERRSCDLSRTLHGIRCRINLLQSARGIGFAIRLLCPFQATLEKLNLHPELKRLMVNTHGLVLVCGPTGSGKSSTLAALIQEINLTDARHIVTIESPIEYSFQPRRAFIRQREVGRDTPSFEQALLDALREDPDVLMVGEMRDPETMRLTLNAAETGHLVLSTLHSGTCAEALQRLVGAFPAEIQFTVSAQLADCLVGVVAQRLRFRPDLNLRVPECEVLMPTNPVKNFIRNREFFKIQSTMETGAEHGMWTFTRYRSWLDKRTQWHTPGPAAEATETNSDESTPATQQLPPLPLAAKSTAPLPAVEKKPVSPQPGHDGRIEIEPVEGGWDAVLKDLE